MIFQLDVHKQSDQYIAVHNAHYLRAQFTKRQKYNILCFFASFGTAAEERIFLVPKTLNKFYANRYGE